MKPVVTDEQRMEADQDRVMDKIQRSFGEQTATKLRPLFATREPGYLYKVIDTMLESGRLARRLVIPSRGPAHYLYSVPVTEGEGAKACRKALEESRKEGGAE